MSRNLRGGKEPNKGMWRGLASSALAIRLSSGAFWSVVGAVFARSIGFGSTVLVARVLGKVGFGEYSAVQATSMMFQSFTGIALGLTATKYVADYRTRDPLKAGRVIRLSQCVAGGCGLVFGLTMVALAPWLASHTLAAPHLKNALIISTASILFASLYGGQLGALTGMEDFKSIATINAVIAAISFPLVAGGAYLGGVTGAVCGSAIASAVNWAYNRAVLRKSAYRLGIPLAAPGFLSEWRIMWRFSLPSAISSTAVGPIIWAGNAILVNQPGGYAELGLYNAVYRVKQIPELIASLVLAPILPVLSEKHGTGETVGYNRVLSLAFLVSAGVVGPIALLLTATPGVVTILYGRQFETSPSLVHYLMLHSILVGLSSPISAVVASLDRMWVGAINNVGWGVLYFAFSCTLVPTYRAAGLAAALALAYFVTVGLSMGYIYSRERHFVGQAPVIGLAGTMLSLYVVCVAASWLRIWTISAAVGALCACCSGFVVFWFFKSITKSRGSQTATVRLLM